MRPSLAVASALTVAAVSFAGYLAFQRTERASEAATSEASPPAANTATATAPETRVEASDRPTSRRASLPARPRAVRVADPAPEARRVATTPLPRKKPVDTDKSLPDASALKPEGATQVAAQPGFAPSAALPENRPAFANPKDQRWIKELSGTRARVQMRKSRQDTSCQPGQACERPDAPKDIRVVGLRVKTERLVDDPSTAVAGHLKQGHYAESTPALYVE